jgi:crossover junction endodeoxyribonuclease RusA
MDITIFVPGQPIPQGSMRGIPIRKRRKDGTTYTGVVQIHDKGATLRAWRDKVRLFAWQEMIKRRLQTSGRPIAIAVDFTVAPCRNGRVCDLDKLTRAVLDAMTGTVYKDDSQVSALMANRFIASVGDPLGAKITVEETVQ